MHFRTQKPQSLCRDTRGLVITTELIVLTLIVAVGMVAGLTAMRDAVVSELSDVSGSVQDANQSYQLSGSLSQDGFTAGSQFGDALDVLDSPDDVSGQADNCIRFDEPPIDEVEPPSPIDFNASFEEGIDTSLAVRRFGRGTRAYLFDADDIDGWQTTAGDNLIEIWETGFAGVVAPEGDYFAEINATRNAQLFQEFAVNPGDNVNYSVWHRGRVGIDSAAVLIGAPGAQTQNQVLTTGNSAWVNYSGTYTVPAGVTTLRIGFESVSTATGNPSVGNLIDNLEVIITN